ALFEVERLASRDDLTSAFSRAAPTAEADTARTRIGVWSAGLAAVLWPRPGALDALLAHQATPATRTLGVTVLEAAMLATFGLVRAAVARGEPVRYVNGVKEAVDAAG